MSIEDYEDKIFDILIKQHGWTEAEVNEIGTLIAHYHMKGLRPEAVAEDLAANKEMVVKPPSNIKSDEQFLDFIKKQHEQERKDGKRK